MRALTEWGKDRFKPMVMLAHITALATEDSHRLVLKSRGASILTKFCGADARIEDWLDLYRHRDWLEGVMLQAVFDAESAVDPTSSRGLPHDLRRELNASLQDDLKRVLAGQVTEREGQIAKRMIEWKYRREHLPMVRAMIEDNEPLPANTRDWLAKTEVLFFLTVAAPCWLEYRETPWSLYRRACRRKVDAMEKLLRLDPEIDKDSRLAERMFEMRRQNPDTYDFLQHARAKGRTNKVTLVDMKFLLGGLLVRWSKEMHSILQGELFFEVLEESVPLERRAEMRRLIRIRRDRAKRDSLKCRLNAADIKTLFDAVAKDRDGLLVDPDFTQQPHAIAKRLNRNSSLWPSLRKTDKNRAASWAGLRRR